MRSLQFRAMNTDILLAAEGRDDRVESGLQRAEEFIRLSEARFTRFSETSELSALNRSAGGWFQGSPQLFEVMRLSRAYYHLTRGLFDPSILPDLKRAGYDRSLEVVRRDGAAPLFDSLMTAGARHSFSEVDLEEAELRIRLPEGMSVDLGGIAKGWIAEQAARILSEEAETCAVNAGGDMFLVGLPAGNVSWPVELEDPFQPADTLAVLNVDPGAVATSTITKRVWKQGEMERHHLIDPRTGEPAQADWVSVTVMAAHACEAEVFAKALLIAGPRQADEIVHAGGTPFSYLAVDWNKNMWGARDRLVECAPEMLEAADVR
jgi:thiamine biosynthesis lipoprotein